MNKMVNENELIELFDNVYALEEQAAEIKASIKDELKNFAESAEVSPKAINGAYALFKKYKGGKQTSVELDELSMLSSMVDGYFSN